MASTIGVWRRKAIIENILCNLRFYPIHSPIFICSFEYRKSQVNADAEMKTAFKMLCTQENDTVRQRTITHLGRDLVFQQACGQVLNSSFDELCDRVSCSFFFHF